MNSIVNSWLIYKEPDWQLETWFVKAGSYGRALHFERLESFPKTICGPILFDISTGAFHQHKQFYVNCKYD